MRSFDGGGDLLAQFREKRGNDAIPGQALAVSGFEEFFSDDAVRIDEIVSGASKSLLHPGTLAIQDSIVGYGFGVRVCQERVRDLVAVSKELEDTFGVVADGRQLDALLFESRKCTLQLDQLPFAERSPVGGTEEEKNRAALPLQGGECLRPAELVA